MDEPIVSPAVPEKEKVDKIGLVQPGMEVYDAAGKKIGKVDGIHSGADDRQPGAPAVQPVPATTPNAVPVPVVVVNRSDQTGSDLNDALGANDDIPRELRARLEHNGF